MQFRTLYCLFTIILALSFNGIAQNKWQFICTNEEFVNAFQSKQLLLPNQQYPINIFHLDENMLTGKIEYAENSQIQIFCSANNTEGFAILDLDSGYIFQSNRTDLFAKKVSNHEILCIEREALPSSEEEVVQIESVPVLNSKPTAGAVIYLDFDGHYVYPNSPWNNGNAIDASPAGITEFAIEQIWSRISDDFAPYQVNVSTDVDAFQSAPSTQRIRVVFTRHSSWYPQLVGGVAYLRSFSWASDVPCWVFVNNLAGTQSIAETGSHEAGHTLGLSHDGDNVNEYYRGHNMWAPIMGASFSRRVTHWSKGEYNNANNAQDDFQIMSQYISFETDDHMNDTNNASQFNFSVVNQIAQIDPNQNTGLISSANDIDYFRINAGMGNLNLEILPTTTTPGNLDLKAEIIQANGQVIATEITNHYDLDDGVTINTSLPGNGTYYLKISGNGTGNGASGYTNYGSTGYYSIQGSYPTAQSFNRDISIRILELSAPTCASEIQLAIEIFNHGENTLSNSNLSISNNGNEVIVFNYNETLISGQKDTISITVQPESGTNQILVIAQDVNGLTDENIFNNTASKNYNISIGEPFTFEIDKPFVSSALFWSILETGGNEIVNSTQLDTTHINSKIVQQICLPTNTCFDFNIENPFEANSCSGYPIFDPNQIYNPGERFIYNNILYEPNVIVHSISDPSAWPQYITEIDQCGSLTGNESFQLTSESSAVFQINSQEAGNLFNTNFCSNMITTTTNVALEEIEIFPNPTDGKVNFNMNFDKLELFDAQGQLLQVINNHNSIDITNYPSGIYFVKVILTGRSFYKQLVRQ
jgi:archaellum component FlaF (FlaF/FlaG flagellin family)